MKKLQHIWDNVKNCKLKLKSLALNTFTYNFIYKRTHRLLSKIKSKMILFWTYVNSTTYDEYLAKSTSLNKTLVETFIEWTVDVVLVYLCIGIMFATVLAFAFTSELTFVLIIVSSFAWWLLERLLRKVKE